MTESFKDILHAEEFPKSPEDLLIGEILIDGTYSYGRWTQDDFKIYQELLTDPLDPRIESRYFDLIVIDPSEKVLLVNGINDYKEYFGTSDDYDVINRFLLEGETFENGLKLEVKKSFGLEISDFPVMMIDRRLDNRHLLKLGDSGTFEHRIFQIILEQDEHAIWNNLGSRVKNICWLGLDVLKSYNDTSVHNDYNLTFEANYAIQAFYKPSLRRLKNPQRVEIV